MKGANTLMKKIVLTIAALAASAAIIFSFAGCEKKDNEEPTTDAVVAEVESESIA